LTITKYVLGDSVPILEYQNTNFLPNMALFLSLKISYYLLNRLFVYIVKNPFRDGVCTSECLYGAFKRKIQADLPTSPPFPVENEEY